jgi:type II secretory ATPase GspE/PulE/Tfp pilus assembly ATPase PilB-like protein
MDRELTSLSANPEAAPEFVEQLLKRAEAARASDIHIHMRGDHAEIAFRLDGVMTPFMKVPRDTAERVFGRIKFLARLKTYQELLPQEGRIEKDSLNSAADLRVATYPTVTGEKIVLRLFAARETPGLPELGFAEDVRSELATVLQQASGMLLLTGPAGSGKTTTIYACLQHLAAAGGRHIITIEDPVEQVLPGLMQTEINEARELTFARAARQLLRQDPEVLVIGEIRDEETARIAVRAALTGHLLIATLHAGSCRGVFERLLTLCTDLSAVASCAELVLNQRLLRRVCPACAGKRCEQCLQTGYRGRLPIVEYVRADDSLRECLRAGRLEEVAPKIPLKARAQSLIAQGLTSDSEARRVLA